MTQWISYQHQGKPGFGQLEGESIKVFSGSLFNNPVAIGNTLALSEVEVSVPCVPQKMICLVDNFHALVTKLDHAVPQEPLWFIKANNALLASGAQIQSPKSYEGKVIFEAELGIVIGQRLHMADEVEAAAGIFGYTCVNDVTAVEILQRDPGYAQWCRSKSFDSFGPLGPVITTGIDPMGLTIKAILNDQERQNYPVSDMIFPPAKLVSLLSRDLTLMPGDVIACGTSVGVGSMKPGSTIVIEIDGVGRLTNTFQ
jgi:2-keto-4-pentenoate hydratase/2-oxohepta-3-ene-1,7-dioic acid hydratase in catechol pathway